MYSPVWSERTEQVCPFLRVDLEGKQLLRVHVIEGTKLWQLQQQLGEDGRLVRVVLHDQVPQRSDQVLLKSLHRAYVLNTSAIWKQAMWWSVTTL